MLCVCPSVLAGAHDLNMESTPEATQTKQDLYARQAKWVSKRARGQTVERIPEKSQGLGSAPNDTPATPRHNLDHQEVEAHSFWILLT